MNGFQKIDANLIVNFDFIVQVKKTNRWRVYVATTAVNQDTSQGIQELPMSEAQADRIALLLGAGA